MGLLTRLKRLPGQLLGGTPFKGSLRVERLPVVESALITFRHFRTPLKILDHIFKGESDLKYLDVPGFAPILFVRDPEVIRAITVETANQGNFDRDTLPTQGIARVVGGSNLLFAQGETWRKHRAAAARAEAFVCLTLFLRRFEFSAAGSSVAADSGVSTRPADKVDLELSLRFFGRAPASPGSRTAVAPKDSLQ